MSFHVPVSTVSKRRGRRRKKKASCDKRNYFLYRKFMLILVDRNLTVYPTVSLNHIKGRFFQASTVTGIYPTLNCNQIKGQCNSYINESGLIGVNFSLLIFSIWIHDSTNQTNVDSTVSFVYSAVQF